MQQKGVTLLELLVTLTLLGILLTIALPSAADYQRKQSLSLAVSKLYFLFRQAQNLALTHQQDISVILQTQEPWCVGLTTATYCDCGVTSQCRVTTQEWRFSQPEPRRVTLLPHTFANGRIRFDGIHGMAFGFAGTLRVTDGVRQVSLVVNNLGRVRICMQQGELGRYPSCNG